MEFIYVIVQPGGHFVEGPGEFAQFTLRSRLDTGTVIPGGEYASGVRHFRQGTGDSARKEDGSNCGKDGHYQRGNQHELAGCGQKW